MLIPTILLSFLSASPTFNSYNHPQTYVMDVDVFGDKVPLDEPPCGYFGELCREEPSK